MAVLDLLLLEDVGRLLEELHVDPLGDIPMLLRYQLWIICQSAINIRAHQKTHSWRVLPYWHFALVSACVRFLNSSVKGLSLKKIHG